MSPKVYTKENFPHVPAWDVLGIKIQDMGDGEATLKMRFDEKLTNPYGFLHGSYASVLADSAVAVAIVINIKARNEFYTIEMKVNYLEPVTEGVIEARAKILREGRIIPGEVDIYNENKLVAKAIATYIIVDENKKS